MRKENKIVYVTGCLGFIGSYVTRACLDKGWYVRGIDKITYASNPNLLLIGHADLIYVNTLRKLKQLRQMTILLIPLILVLYS